MPASGSSPGFVARRNRTISWCLGLAGSDLHPARRSPMIEGMIRITLLGAAVAAASVLAAPATPAPAPVPDAHDRALIANLDTKVTTFRKLAAERGDDSKVDESLKTCPAVQKDPSQAFGAVLVLLPALLAELVNEYRPQLTEVHDTLTAMRPHSRLFRRWVTAKARASADILQFDNHGKKINYCDAATVLLNNGRPPPTSGTRSGSIRR